MYLGRWRSANVSHRDVRRRRRRCAHFWFILYHSANNRDPTALGPLLSRMDRIETMMTLVAAKLGVDASSVDAGASSKGSAEGGVAAAALAGLKFAGGTTSTAPQSINSLTRPLSRGKSGEKHGSDYISLSLTWTEPEDAAREEVLWKMLDILPDTRTVRQVCELYVSADACPTRTGLLTGVDAVPRCGLHVPPGRRDALLESVKTARRDPTDVERAGEEAMGNTASI